MKSLSFFTLIAVSLLFSSCGESPETVLRNEILKSARDNQIDDKEWVQIQSLAKETDYKDCSKLTDFIAKVCQRKGSPTMPACGADKPKNTAITDFSVFVENSNSMMGYITGPSEFKEALMDIPTRLQGKGGKCKFHFINNKPYEISTDYRTFLDKLDEKEAKKIGDIRNSRLHEIIKQVTDIVVKEKRIAILASDFIYDVDRKNPKDELPTLKFATKSQIQSYKKMGDFGVLVLRMKSTYTGNYYDYRDKGTRINDKRPYYIWIFGPTQQLIDIYRNYNLHTLKGFDNYAIFYNTDGKKSDLFYTVLPQTNKEGSFSREKDSKEVFHVLERTKLDDRKNSLQFSVLVNLSELPTPDAYLLDSKNYVLTSDRNDVFELVSVVPVSSAKIHENDRRFIGSSTHMLTIKTTKLSVEEQNLSIRLRKQMPNWIVSSSTDDDSNIQQTMDKTFGLNYLMAGLAEAYDESGTTPSYLNFMITIKK